MPYNENIYSSRKALAIKVQTASEKIINYQLYYYPLNN